MPEIPPEWKEYADILFFMLVMLIFSIIGWIDRKGRND